MLSQRLSGRVMSAKVISVNDNDDVEFVCSIEGQTATVIVAREAIENCKFSNVEQYADFSKKQKEDLTANVLVWLSENESRASLQENYKIVGTQLDRLLGE